jgi:hypothetical protein
MCAVAHLLFLLCSALCLVIWMVAGLCVYGIELNYAIILGCARRF